jgi:hypothetical protein
MGGKEYQIMTEQFLCQFCNDQVQFFNALVEPRRPDETDDRFVAEITEIVPAMFRLSKSLQYVQDVTRKAALEGRIKTIQATGEGVDSLLDAAVRLCEVLQARCHKAIAAGHEIEPLPDLARITDDIRRMREDWIRKWPFVDSAMLERSAVEYAEGKFQTAKDALHELRNHHS